MPPDMPVTKPPNMDEREWHIHRIALRVLGIGSNAIKTHFTKVKNIADPKVTIEILNRKVFSTKDTSVQYRVINHWGSLGLLNDDRKKASQGWRKFSLKQIIWIRTIALLRDCGLPLEKIQMAHAMLVAPQQAGLQSLDMAITLCTRRVSVSLLVLFDGTAGIFEPSSAEMVNEWLGSQHHIRISLNQILQEIAGNDDFAPLSSKQRKLTPAEKDVINAIREDDNESVHISLQRGSITYIDTTKTVKGAAALLNSLNGVAYGEMTVKVENGKPVQAKVRHKRKIYK